MKIVVFLGNVKEDICAVAVACVPFAIFGSDIVIVGALVNSSPPVITAID